MFTPKCKDTHTHTHTPVTQRRQEPLLRIIVWVFFFFSFFIFFTTSSFFFFLIFGHLDLLMWCWMRHWETASLSFFFSFFFFFLFSFFLLLFWHGVEWGTAVTTLHLCVGIRTLHTYTRRPEVTSDDNVPKLLKTKRTLKQICISWVGRVCNQNEGNWKSRRCDGCVGESTAT